MQQFVVPQFIDVEDKIIGPLTTRQFLIMLAGGFGMFIEFKVADFSLFVFLGLFTLALTGLFAFLKVNGMPFHFFVKNFLETLRSPKRRVWRKQVLEGELADFLRQPAAVVRAPTLARHQPLPHSRLQQLALEVDTGGVFKMEDEKIENEKIKQQNV